MDAIIPLLVACVSAISAVVIAVFQVRASQRQKRDDADRERRQKDYQARDQRREELLVQLLKNTRINGELAQATALAVKRGKTNGEMDEALRNYSTFEKEMDEYVAKSRAQGFNQVQTVKIEKDSTSLKTAIIMAATIVFILVLLSNLFDYMTKVWFL